MEKLGQHFLTNEIKLQKIARTLDLKADDSVIEIGPGHGELTLILAKNFQFIDSKFQLIAIEKDEKLLKSLQKKFKTDENIELIKGDALEIIPQLAGNHKLQNENYKITGNIPYYITGYLLRIIGELENKPLLVVLTIQKEVAERICAEPPKMNLLAASVQFWAEPKIIDYIPKSDFKPQPKVDSTIIKLTTNNLRLTTQETENYYKLIKILFKQPRKTILNNLKPATENLQLLTKKLELIGINSNDRPQNLNIEQIKKIASQWR
ncbi:MAG: 16S rRNA (adenine(1518)-N(6)/adenine(1519)-N(6))-dimethyltransferase RsmA [Candidatus Paceibacterota bacterium]